MLKRQIVITEIETVIKELPKIKVQDQIASQVHSIFHIFLNRTPSFTLNTTFYLLGLLFSFIIFAKYMHGVLWKDSVSNKVFGV